MKINKIPDQNGSPAILNPSNDLAAGTNGLKEDLLRNLGGVHRKTTTNSARHYYPKTWFIGVVQAAFAIYVGLAHWLNPLPLPYQLIRIHVKVLGVQALAPDLHVQLEDGRQRMMEFPVDPGRLRSRYYGMDATDKKKLTGCSGYVEGVPVRLVLEDRFRVWALRCGDVNFTLEDSKRYFIRLNPSNVETYWGYWIGIFLLTGFIFWVEQRNYKRSSK